MNKLIEEKVRAAIVQSPEIIQGMRGGGKNIVVNVMINGNDAIDRACADNGDLIAAMKHIISVLPEPKEVWLISLAMAAGIDLMGSKNRASAFLGISRDRFGREIHGYADKVRAILDGEAPFGGPDIEEVSSIGR